MPNPSATTTPAAPGGQASATAALAGKYMTFQLAKEDYGLEILKVREIIGLMEITRMPKAPGYVRGVINLRGRVIPVVDLRVKFGLPAAEATDQTVIIVVQVAAAGHAVTLGVLVDEVLEVLDVTASAIEPPPDLGGMAVEPSFILGVGKTAHRVVFLLDIASVLSGADASRLSLSARS